MILSRITATNNKIRITKENDRSYIVIDYDTIGTYTALEAEELIKELRHAIHLVRVANTPRKKLGEY